MIQKVTAANMVSRDSVTRNLAVLDSVAKVAPSPIKPVLYLIEADVYNSVYNFIHWKADSRQLPADSLPQNPFEWSRDMFADKVYDLSNMALSIRDNDGKPLKTWSSFLTESDMAYKYGMTADEFIIWKCTSVLSPFADETQDVIPFFAETGDPTTPGRDADACGRKLSTCLSTNQQPGTKHDRGTRPLNKRDDHSIQPARPFSHIRARQIERHRRVADHTSGSSVGSASR